MDQSCESFVFATFQSVLLGAALPILLPIDGTFYSYWGRTLLSIPYKH